MKENVRSRAVCLWDIVTLAWFSALAADQPTKGKVFLLLGQSNMVGLGKINTTPGRRAMSWAGMISRCFFS